jgi:hypothetical protein
MSNIHNPSRPYTLKERALDLPKEHEMPAKDKYTIFTPHTRGYRKGIHKVPKWTRVRVPLLQATQTDPTCSSRKEQIRKGFNHAMCNLLEKHDLDLALFDCLQHLWRTKHRLEHLVSRLRDIQHVAFLRVSESHIQNNVRECGHRQCIYAMWSVMKPPNER